MKTLFLFIVAAFCCFLAKGQDSTVTLLPLTGYSTLDKNGLTVDSVSNHIWYKCNYKDIPAHGVWADTCISVYKDSGYRSVGIRAFLNRKVIFSVMFIQPYTTAKYSKYNWFISDIYKKNILQ